MRILGFGIWFIVIPGPLRHTEDTRRVKRLHEWIPKRRRDVSAGYIQLKNGANGRAIIKIRKGDVTMAASKKMGQARKALARHAVGRNGRIIRCSSDSGGGTNTSGGSGDSGSKDGKQVTLKVEILIAAIHRSHTP